MVTEGGNHNDTFMPFIIRGIDCSGLCQCPDRPTGGKSVSVILRAYHAAAETVFSAEWKVIFDGLYTWREKGLMDTGNY